MITGCVARCFAHVLGYQLILIVISFASAGSEIGTAAAAAASVLRMKGKNSFFCFAPLKWVEKAFKVSFRSFVSQFSKNSFGACVGRASLNRFFVLFQSLSIMLVIYRTAESQRECSRGQMMTTVKFVEVFPYVDLPCVTNPPKTH